MISGADLLEKYWEKSSTLFYRALLNVAMTEPGSPRHSASIDSLAQLNLNTQIYLDMVGRYSVYQQLDGARFAEYDIKEGAIPPATLPFLEAIEDLLRREPRLANVWQEVARLYTTDKAFALAHSQSLEITRRIRDEAAKMMARGASVEEAAKAIQDIATSNEMADVRNWTRAYCEVAYRTIAASSFNEGRFAQAQRPEAQEAIPALRYSSINDSSTRPNHAAADGLIAATGDPIWKRLRPPQGFQCVVGDTRVSADIVGASKALYSGPVIEIETVDGNRLTVTVNHPIFANGGWVAAKDLNKGDKLLAYSDDIKFIDTLDKSIPLPPTARRGVDDQQFPPIVKDVFEALWREGVGTFRTNLPSLSLDLHGDGAGVKGDIYIVRPDWMLPSTIEASFFDFGNDVSFKLPSEPANLSGHASSAIYAMFNGSFKPPGGGVSSAALVRALSDAHLAPFKRFSLGLAPKLNVISDESMRYNSAPEPEFLRKLQDASASKIAPDEILSVKLIPQYDGHVYDLQTSTGWMIANGIVISNCRCSIEFVSRYDLERMGLFRNGHVVPYYPPGVLSGAAHPDAGFKPGV